MKMLELATLLYAKLTKTVRYRPEIVWSDNCWTHNIFRLYELVFGRKYGIRPEMAVSSDGITTTYECFTFEACCALFEMRVRQFLAGLRPKVVKVYYPVLAPAGFGQPLVRSPYLFAIAFDAASTAGNISTSTSPLNFNQTVSGSDRRMYVQAGQRNASTVSGVTFNSVSLTQVGSTLAPPSESSWGNSIWRLIAPDTGTNQVSISYGGGADLRGSSVSYTGCDQATTSDVNTTGTDSTSPFALTLTVPANGWTVGFIGMNSGTVVASTGSTYRTDNVGITSIFDSNGAQTGSYTMNWTFDSGAGENLCGHMVAFAPAAAGGPTTVKTFDGVTQSSGIKTYFGVTVGNTKSVNGIT